MAEDAGRARDEERADEEGREERILVQDPPEERFVALGGFGSRREASARLGGVGVDAARAKRLAASCPTSAGESPGRGRRV
jgi:hypothetical protein